MFGDMFFAAQPVSFPEFVEDSLLDRMAADFFEDEALDTLMEPWQPDRDLVFRSRAWVKPRQRWCPYTCGVTRPRRPTHRHFVILPRLASDTTANNDHPCGKGSPNSYKTKDKEQNSFHSRKQTVSAPGVSGEGSISGTRDDAGSNCSPTDTAKVPGGSPWQFSVDMNGCDEVRAMTEGGMLMVEGRGSSDNSKQMVRYITSLPRHVSHDSLTARLNNGRLTVTQKGEAKLECQAKTLPIDVQQEKSPESTKQQQEQSEAKKHVQEAISSRSARKVPAA